MNSLSFLRWARAAACTVAVAAGVGLQAKVLDDFNGPARTGWQDANPANLPLPPAAQAGGRLTFVTPRLGQPYFASATKTSETFELKEGRTVEFRVDLVNGRGPDSFAVLGFIPQATGPNSLAGYGIAKSESDILITKGINKYFHNEALALKNENVTLVLSLTVEGGDVHIKGQVLDKDAANAVIWEKTYVDTPGADQLRTGTDSPAAPFVNLVGNFVLYLYSDGGTDPDGYTVTYDNAHTFVSERSLVDNFNGATRAGWEDKNPAGLPLPPATQADGTLTFLMPKLGQPYFASARKTTVAYDIVEGTRHEFIVDLVNGKGPDSFAVMGWIPAATGANSLAGYGIAKSETDILVTKGINKYFHDEPTALKNNNVRLSLTLTVVNGMVEILARVLDLDDSRKVIFEKRFVDTAAAETLAGGADSPAAPFLGTGHVVLYLYADGGQDDSGYTVTYDNVVVSSPLAQGNLAPVISDIAPLDGSNFLPASSQVSFRVTDDKALPDAAFKVTLNGVERTTANGLTLSAAGTSRTATLGGLEADKSYQAVLSVTDSNGETRTQTVFFDTFTSVNRIVEIEDYNFEGGGFFNNPARTAEGSGAADNSFTDRAAVEDVDVNETRTSPRPQDSMYRTSDPVRMQRTLDRARTAFNGDLGVYDYDVGDLAADEWMNYTRDFPTGSYEVYLREAVVNFARADSVLELVTGNRTQPNQTVRLLGSFLGRASGFTFRNVPLTDGTGQNKVVVRLSGLTTLRLRTVTPDDGTGTRYLNYLVFVPVANAGVQRAAVASVSPANDALVESVDPKIEVSIENRDTTVNVSTVRLAVNGADVAATVTATPTGATVAYTFPVLPAKDVAQTASVRFKDNEGADVTTAWSFTVTYARLDPATRFAGRGVNRGFNFHLVQSPPENGPLENSLARAEEQLAGTAVHARVVDTNGVTQVVNYSQNAPFGTDGGFGDDLEFPGVSGDIGNDNIAMSATAWLDLPAGIVRFGVISDDGYKFASSVNPGPGTPALGFHNGGPASEVTDVVVPEAGLYAFRLVWYERTGGAHVEWFTENRSNGQRTLLNAAGGIPAFATVEAVAPAVVLQASGRFDGGFANEPGATVDTAAKTVRVAAGGGDARFYRLTGASALTIDSISLDGTTVVIRYR